MATRAERPVPTSKAAKQKKILFLLVPALVILLLIQWPRIKDQIQGAQANTQQVQGEVVEAIKEVAPSEVVVNATVGTETANPSEALSAATASLADDGLADTDTQAPPAQDDLNRGRISAAIASCCAGSSRGSPIALIRK